MKGIPKSKGFLTAVLIAAMVTAGGMPMTGTSHAATYSSDESGGVVGLEKTAEEIGANKWKITLSVTGGTQGKSSDIVIVMDRSRSMNNNNKLSKAKEAAVNLVNQIYKTNEDTRLAFMTFNKTATLEEGFTGIGNGEDISDLIDVISGIDADYPVEDRTSGTNIQAGIHKAACLFEDSDADLKIIVLVGDGEPTYSYALADGASAVFTGCSVTGGVHDPKWNEAGVSFDYDENKITGDGAHYEFTSKIKAVCTVNNKPHYYPGNHGVPAIFEAKKAADQGIDIYSVGIGVKDVKDGGKDVLKNCKSKGAGYIDIKTSDNSYDFLAIAAAISAKDAFRSEVTDPIGEDFVLVGSGDFDWAIGGEPDEDAEVAVSRAESVEYDTGGRVITWKIGDLYPGETATMSYFVKAKPGIIFEEGEANAYPTNGETTIEYEYPEGGPITTEFGVPEVPLTGGAVILKAIAVNAAGLPVTTAGEVTDLQNAALLDQGRFPANPTEFVTSGNCQVSMANIPGCEYRGYQFAVNGSTEEGGPSDYTADIELTPETGFPTVYFKFLKTQSQPGPNGSNGDDGNNGGGGGGGDGGNNGGGGGGGDGGGPDITASAVTPPALNKLDHYAYILGYPDGEVKPLGTITREEVAVIFYRLMTEESRKMYGSTVQPFTDVAADRWSNDEIATLYNAKIIQGNSDGSFLPAQPITRAEFATIATKFDKLEEVEGNKFPDIENHWAKKYINCAAEKCWITGYGDGTFRPDNIIIRCEAMKLINEVLDRRVNIEGLHPDTKHWPDNTPDKWYYEIVLEATNTHDYERADKPKSIEKWTRIKPNPVW